MNKNQWYGVDGDKSNKAVVFTHAAPGFVATRWGTEMPMVIRWLVRMLQFFGRSEVRAASTMFPFFICFSCGCIRKLISIVIYACGIFAWLKQDCAEYMFAALTSKPSAAKGNTFRLFDQ